MINYVTRANVIVFAALAVILVLLGAMTWDRSNASRSAEERSEHTFNTLAAIKDLNIQVRNAEAGQRGYLLTGSDDYLSPYRNALDQVSFLQGKLQRLTAADPAQQDRLRNLSSLIQHKLEELAQTVELRRTVGLDAALKVVQTDAGNNYMKSIEAVLTEMSTREQGVLEERLAAGESRGNTVRWLAVAGTFLAVAALIWAAALLNRAWVLSQAMEAEQRTAALRLRSCLDSLSQGVAVFDPGFYLTNWNGCFQELLDVPKAIIRTGMPYAAFTGQTQEGGTSLLEDEDQVRHGRGPANSPVVYERSRLDGHQLEIRRTQMPDGGFVLTLTDMTKRAQAEAVLREAQKMQAIGQLTGGIAHDFNNLLTVILGNLEFVRAKLNGQDAMLARIERAAWAAERGATLTAQLLAFARRQPLAPSAIDLAAAMPDLVPLLRRTLGEQIDVRYIESAGLWPAMADPAQLESAVLNLALNARDAMPNGGRLTIEIANRVLDEQYARDHAEVKAGDYAMVAVSDTGHGMTPDVVARVFEPFFTTKLDGKGTGLGLAMVFGFVKQSGGHVSIYSEPNEGTTVRLYLPRAVGAASPALRRTGLPVELPRGSATVLVVEDEAAVREIAVAILNDLGYRVLEAADGDEGLRVFDAHATEIGLLLTDVVLPGKIRGRELADRATAIRPGIRVLFMSGYTENSIVHGGRLDDGVHLIGKPFAREQLARKVAEVLEGYTAGAGNHGGSPDAADSKPR